MRKALPLTLVLIGAALLITAVIFWIDSITSTEPQSFGKILLDWVALIAGLSASIKGWIELFKKEETIPPTTTIDADGGNPQISTGDHAHNIQTNIYIESQTIQQSPDEISFTAIYPKESRVETWHTLLVYTHLLSAIEEIRRDAHRFQDQLPISKEITTSASAHIARGTEIAIVPSVSGLIFNPRQVSFRWLEDYHRAEFRFHANNSLVNDAARGQINIYVGPFIIGTLKPVMLVNETESREVVEHEEHGNMYHQDDIFVSYSHKDSSVVLACKKAYEALGFNVLIDIDTLRAGQIWNEELIKMIERANIFQLFWSQNSGESECCRKEWQHALKCGRQEGFIRPVYWKVPMPSPPPELRQFHFDYVELI